MQDDVRFASFLLFGGINGIYMKNNGLIWE